jgi:Ca2+/Na+ antiporter
VTESVVGVGSGAAVGAVVVGAAVFVGTVACCEGVVHSQADTSRLTTKIFIKVRDDFLKLVFLVCIVLLQFLAS